MTQPTIWAWRISFAKLWWATWRRDRRSTREVLELNVPSTTPVAQVVKVARRWTHHQAWVGINVYSLHRVHDSMFNLLLSLCIVPCCCLQGNRNRAKLPVGNQSLLTWVRPILQESVPLQCPPSTLREITTDKLKPKPSGVGMTGPHPQVRCPVLPEFTLRTLLRIKIALRH